MPPFLRITSVLVLVSICCTFSAVVGQQSASTTVSEAAEIRDKGIAQFSHAEYEKAIKTLKRAAELNPNDPMVWDYLGQAYHELLALPEAVVAYERAIQLRPDFVPTRLRLVSFLFFAGGNFDRAEKAARETLAVAPRNPFPHYVIGTIKFRQQMPEAALTEAEAALAIDPRFGDALLLKSQAMWSLSHNRKDSSDSVETRKAYLQKAVQALEDFAKLGGHKESSAYWRTQLATLRGMLEESEHPAAETPRIYKQSEVTVRARVTSKPGPEYTDEARHNGEVGTLRISGVLGADGKISRILVLYGLSAGLTAQAVAAMQRVKFNPALLDGKPVSQYVTFEYSFNIY